MRQQEESQRTVLLGSAPLQRLSDEKENSLVGESGRTTYPPPREGLNLGQMGHMPLLMCGLRGAPLAGFLMSG